MTEYFDLADLRRQAEQTGAVVRDLGLLVTAVHRPKASVFGADAYGSSFEKAAPLLHSMAQDQPLVNGNKPLGMWGAS